MTVRFQDLPWHDAAILSIAIDRSRAGVRDEVHVAMAWPDERPSSTIVFLECYAFTATMSFGVVAAESVLTATESEDDPDLQLAHETWGKLGVDLSALKKFTIETNSTASVLTVLARRWEER